ncbi:hypothetical protein AB833_31680 [Chromatiales bacterium (ex Bugula neritina AB1)]|nr:hypothetical protein AB833_31680 [Chromatiales bacterium (ex Bugula neritina AB1)]
MYLMSRYWLRFGLHFQLQVKFHPGNSVKLYDDVTDATNCCQPWCCMKFRVQKLIERYKRFCTEFFAGLSLVILK